MSAVLDEGCREGRVSSGRRQLQLFEFAIEIGGGLESSGVGMHGQSRLGADRGPSPPFRLDVCPTSIAVASSYLYRRDSRLITALQGERLADHIHATRSTRFRLTQPPHDRRPRVRNRQKHAHRRRIMCAWRSPLTFALELRETEEKRWTQWRRTTAATTINIATSTTR